jgi:hypothetical protein
MANYLACAARCHLGVGSEEIAYFDKHAEAGTALDVNGSHRWHLYDGDSLVLVLTATHMAAIGLALTMENGPGSSSLHSLLHDSQLWPSLRMRVSLALSIAFLMTVKPN